MTFSTHEEHAAAVILENAKRKRADEFQADHAAAARDLHSRFLKLAQGLGYSASHRGDGVYTLGLGGKATVTITPNDRGAISIATYNPNDLTESGPVVAPLDFDPVAGVLLGAEIDTDTAPTPGAPLPRVAPLVVLARIVADKINRPG